MIGTGAAGGIAVDVAETRNDSRKADLPTRTIPTDVIGMPQNRFAIDRFPIGIRNLIPVTLQYGMRGARTDGGAGVTQLGSPDGTAGLGFPWGAVLSSATTVASQLIPGLGGEDPKLKALRETRRYEAANKFLSSDLQNLATDLSNNLTVEEAVQIIETNAATQFARRENEYESVFLDQGVPDAELLATTAAEAARSVYLEEASNVLFWDKAPLLALGGAVLIGGLIAGWYYLT